MQPYTNRTATFGEKKVIPTREQWKSYRTIIQHWSQTMRAACEIDLPAEDFIELEKAVLFGDALDSQILGMVKRFPKNFHIGMIPDLKSASNWEVQESDAATQEHIKAESAKWEAELRLFRSNLNLDWQMMKRCEVGSKV